MKIKRTLSLLLVLCLCLSLSVSVFASGEASGEGGSSGNNYEDRPVYASGVYEMPDEDAVEATYTLYGYYNTTDPSADDAFTVLDFAEGTTAAVYTDSSCTELLDGVTASFDGETLTLTLDEAPTSEIYGYVLFDDGQTDFTAVPVYIVSYASNAIYLNATTDYNGYELRYDADVYTPGAVYYHEGISDAIVAGALDLFGAEDFADEIAAAAEETGYDYDLLYDAVDFYLHNGTTGGDTWEEFVTDRVVDVNPTDATDPVAVGDGYLRVEACYYLFRYYWMNNNTYEVTAGDQVTGIFGDNMTRLYEDFTDFYRGN